LEGVICGIVARDFVLGKTFLLSAVLATSTSAIAQASGQANASSTENQSPFQLKITSNLVVARVVGLLVVNEREVCAFHPVAGLPDETVTCTFKMMRC
jgi:hypothetical protein